MSASVQNVLGEAQRRGLLGPGPLEGPRQHALGFAEAIGEPPGRALDIGSGGGLPGLVLAELWPESEWVLLDGAKRSTGFLEGAIVDLGWAHRVTVVHARAELAGRDPSLRASFELVTARSFAAPAVLAECAAPFLLAAGHIVVSDPPAGAGERWPVAGLAEFGLAVARHTETNGHFTVLRQEILCPDRFPRPPGLPAKRPLF